MKKNKQLRYKTSFEKAVSLLSIAGYYLEGFVEDEDLSKESYEVYKRYQDPKFPAARIYRNGRGTLFDNYSNPRKSMKELIGILSKNTYFPPKKRVYRYDKGGCTIKTS